jgi:hypothetical protein
MGAMTDQEWRLACDTCFAGDGHHYHPWFIGIAVVSLAVGVLVWLVSRRGPRQVSMLGRGAAILIALGPLVAGMIMASSTEGRRVACGANFSKALETGVPCVNHGTAYRNTAEEVSAASISGGIALSIAAGVAFRRRGVTEPDQLVDEPSDSQEPQWSGSEALRFGAPELAGADVGALLGNGP